MRIDILTVFPNMFKGPFTESLLGKAQNRKILKVNIHDIRSFTKDKHHIVDDKSFGGGPGMVMKPDPVFDAFASIGIRKKTASSPWPEKNKPLVLYMSPQGKTLDNRLVKKISTYKHVVMLCGHYEGVDERIMNLVNQEVSIGDYVLTGGEIPAMVVVDCIARFLPGVVKEEGSVKNDSFNNGLLDYPHYTRPSEFRGLKVPAVLLSGNHKEIQKWRDKHAILNTYKKRPDLLKKIKFTNEQKQILKEIKKKK